MTKQFPDWVQDGADIVVVYAHLNDPQSVRTTKVEKVTKTLVRVEGVTEPFRLATVDGDHLTRSEGGTWSTSKNLVFPVGHPDAERYTATLRVTEAKYRVTVAADAFRDNANAATATALAQAAAEYATLTAPAVQEG